MKLFRPLSKFIFPFCVILFHLIIDSFADNNVKENSVKNAKSNSYLKKETGFFVGKFVTGHYLEYPELNGFYDPKSAVKICDADFECTGFTYQGAKNVGQRFYIYFFRYVAPPSFSLSSVTNEEKVWTSYRVKRSFVVLPKKKEKEESTQLSNVDNKLSTLSENVLSGMAIKSDDKRISFGNKMKWSAPKYKAIIIDPLTKQSNGNQKLRYTFALTEVYANEDEFTLQHFDINRNQTKLLTIIRLDPPIDSADKDNSNIISVPELNQCCFSKKKSVKSQASIDALSKPDIHSCNLNARELREHYIKLQKPLILHDCVNVCVRKGWDFAGDIIPSETGRKWTVADLKTGKFTDNLLSWGEMHNLLSNPNQQPISNYKRIRSVDFARPGDLALLKLIDIKGHESIVPGLENWNLLTNRPTNVIERIEDNTVSGIESNPIGVDSTVTLVSGDEQEWTLIPTIIKSEIKSLSCKPFKSKDCKHKKKIKEYKNMTQWDLNHAWFSHVVPQLKDKTWNGRHAMTFKLNVGDTLFIPSSWSYSIKNEKASILIWENKLTEASVETFAAKIRTEKDQAMVNGLLKVLEKRESERKPRQIFKRLSEALKQVRSTQNKKKKA